MDYRDSDDGQWQAYQDEMIKRQVGVLHECVHGYAIGDINELEARELLASVHINPDDLHKLIREYKESKQYTLDAASDGSESEAE